MNNLTSTPTLAVALVDALKALGVRQAYGIMGGAIAPFFHAAFHSEIEVFHLRHEAGAAFAAIEASFVTRRPVVVFTTAGPGLTNAFTGMAAAQWDGAQVLFISASSASAHRGRVATQETSAKTLGGPGLMLSGGVLDLATTLEHPAQLAPLVRQLATLFGRPGSAVAHVSLPIDVQRSPCNPIPPSVLAASALAPSGIASATAKDHAAKLTASRPLLWLGFGARHASAAIRRLVDRLDARVICSPRAKGVFPEDHPSFLGVTGLGGHTRVEEILEATRPDTTLVLGNRMGESTSFWSPALTPGDAFIHVDTNPAAFGAAYPDITTHAVLADVGTYVDALLAVLGPAPRPSGIPRPTRPHLEARRDGPVRPQALMSQLQRVVVDGSDAWLMAESGNAFCWTTHHLHFNDANRYRVSTGFGSMGHAATGVVGAALARRGKALAVVGDGAMMMLNEIHAAVQYRADAVWVVLNDAGYRMCSQGMEMMGWEPFGCELPPVDFVALARAIGASGERVSTEADLGPALERAMAARGPWVLDVAIDPHPVPPSGRRNKSLMQQGADALPRNP